MPGTSSAARIGHVVTASPLHARMVEACFEARGVECRHFDGVGAALVAVAEERPVVVVTAQELPGLPGASLVAALKASPHHRATPVVLATSQKVEHRSGLPDRIVPFDSDFAAGIARYLDELGLVAGEEGPEDFDARILLAEDAAVNRALYRQVLHVAGATVTAVEDGLEAVEAFESEPFDLVLMDLEMPRMDGREAALRIRERNADTPLLAFTGHAPEAVEDEVAALGFTGVLGKPIAPDRLLERCRELLFAA